MGGLLVLSRESYFFFLPSPTLREGVGIDTSTSGATTATPSLLTLAPTSLLWSLALGPRVTDGRF